MAVSIRIIILNCYNPIFRSTITEEANTNISDGLGNKNRQIGRLTEQADMDQIDAHVAVGKNIKNAACDVT